MRFWRRRGDSRAPEPLTVAVDRDSVAMGDDMQSHRREVQTSPDILMSDLIEQVSPEIRSRGWSWVVVVGDETTAVWSVNHGVQMLRPDVPFDGQSGPVKVFFRYFQQIDPAWLFRRLSEGAKASHGDLEEEYAPLAQEAYERQQRERESSTTKRLLSERCILALEYFGAVIDLHSDVMCRFGAQGLQWTLHRSDTVTEIFREGLRMPRASMRPTDLAEKWIVAAVGAQCRIERGEEPLPPFEQHATEELTQWPGFDKGDVEWHTSDSPVVAQLRDNQAVQVYRFGAGRDIDGIVSLLAT